MINAEVVHDAQAALGEACLWSPSHEALLWVDVDGQAVHRFDHASGQPLEPWRYDDTVANIALRAGGGLVLGLGNTVALTDRAGGIETVIDLPGEPDTNRVNDGAVDPAGRLFQGTMSIDDPGSPVAALYRVDGNCGARRVLSDVMISNGIGWSPDASVMYYIDSLTLRVDRFDYDRDTGSIEGRRPFVTFDGSTGAPDGMTVDAEGCVWVAMFGGFHVQRFSPTGERLEAVATPRAPQTTCCCFGGPDLDTLYVTTAKVPIAGISTEGEPNSGALFAADVDAVGMPTNLFAG